MEYYIVDSVKGGCGKTALAICKALELANANDKNKVCFIDMDLLGTSIEEYLKITLCSDLKPRLHYLSEMFSDKYAIRREKCIRKLMFTKTNFQLLKTELSKDALEDEDLKKDYIKIGSNFSSPLEKHKKLFKPNVTTHYTNHIDYDFFARKLEILFEELENGGYTHIVIDMPPNSDPYTDSVFDLLLNKEKLNKVHLLLISTYDRSHIKANLEWFNDKTVSSDHNWICFDKISIILNDNRGVFTDNESDLVLAHAQTNTMIESYKEINALYNNIDILDVAYDGELSKYSVLDIVDKTTISLSSGTKVDIEQSGLKFKKIIPKNLKN